MNIALLIPILLVAAILISFLGSISGVGGGVIFIPLFLLILTNRSMGEIKYLSTLLVFTSSFINVLIYSIKKNLNLWIVLICVVVSLPTIFLGNFISTLIDDKILKIIIISLLSIVTVILIYNQYAPSNKIVMRQRKTKWYQIKQGNYIINAWSLIGVIVLGGLITSISGMGGGPILMPLLLLIFGLNIKNAAPISHTIIAISSLIMLVTNYDMLSHSNLMIENATPMIIGDRKSVV